MDGFHSAFLGFGFRCFRGWRPRRIVRGSGGDEIVFGLRTSSGLLFDVSVR
jgi:hypothetical protein